MKSARCIEKNVSTCQPTTHLYELSEPYNDHSYVLVTVSTLPHCADDTHVLASTSNGGALPDPETGSFWVLAYFPDDTSHAAALSSLGYEVVSDGAD